MSIYSFVKFRFRLQYLSLIRNLNIAGVNFSLIAVTADLVISLNQCTRVTFFLCGVFCILRACVCVRTVPSEVDHYLFLLKVLRYFLINCVQGFVVKFLCLSFVAGLLQNSESWTVITEMKKFFCLAIPHF